MHYELSGLICAIVNSVSQGNFTVFRKNSEEKIPETPGCSNHVKVPLMVHLVALYSRISVMFSNDLR